MRYGKSVALVPFLFLHFLSYQKEHYLTWNSMKDKKIKNKKSLGFWVPHLRHSAYLDISCSFAALQQPVDRGDTVRDRFPEEAECCFFAKK